MSGVNRDEREVKEMGFLVFLVLVVLPCIFLMIREINSDPKTIERRKEEKKSEYKYSVRTGQEESVKKFYKACLSQGIRDMSREADKERIVLFAKNTNIPGTQNELISAFNKGKELVDSAKQQAEMDKLKNEEAKIKQDNMGYISYVGREKRIKICKDCISVCDMAIEQIKKEMNGSNRTASSLMQKKGDWAIAGGIANGLAGPAAGLVTALGVQERNATIDSNNAAITSAAVAMNLNLLEKQVKVEEEREKWEKKLSKAQQSLYKELPKEQLFEALTVEVKEKKTSATGKGRVTISVSQKTPITIFEDVRAVIDGSLTIYVISGGHVVGQGMIAFPYEGTEHSFTRTVICEGNIPSEYDVMVKPNMLWAIERAK